MHRALSPRARPLGWPRASCALRAELAERLRLKLAWETGSRSPRPGRGRTARQEMRKPTNAHRRDEPTNAFPWLFRAGVSHKKSWIVSHKRPRLEQPRACNQALWNPHKRPRWHSCWSATISWLSGIPGTWSGTKATSRNSWPPKSPRGFYAPLLPWQRPLASAFAQNLSHPQWPFRISTKRSQKSPS